MERLMTTKEVANIVGLSSETIRDKVKKEELNAYRLGNNYYFSRSDVKKWLEGRKVSIDVEDYLKKGG